MRSILNNGTASAKGGKGSHQVVFDVPAEAVTDAKVRVAETISLDDEAGLWATK
ncbi:hypothetical protein [Paeniglutamicibacter sulfureus]|uniref:Uncharacterized protein n=1 Tax=Paeniglutamicibacter sulfureus TaxID=43666 RepID=A0ABU2BIL9_9MICC|nr:hypothetical protein [Paeniglutamicibacter sulfureus]MDR7358106.1 hypothetical protein [Paeniglutamicibacter sulfureus]